MNYSLMDKLERLEQQSSFGTVVETIRMKIREANDERKAQVLERMTEAQFIEHRLSIYFEELEKAVVAGGNLEAANEIALRECLAGLDSED